MDGQRDIISTVGMAIDSLNTAKFMALCDMQNILETGSPDLRNLYLRMAQDHQNMANEWFRLMQGRGWYQVVPGRADVAAQLTSHMQRMASAVDVNYGQTGYGYQPQFNQYGTAPTRNF